MLKFGRWRADGSALATVSFDIPDHKTELSGEFEIIRPFNPRAQLGKRDRPYVFGSILIPPRDEPHLRMGYFGKSIDGARRWNLTGTTFNNKPGFVASTSFEPQVTAAIRTRTLDLQYKHVRLKPGRYFFFVVLDKTSAAGQWAEIAPDAELTLATTIKESDTGSIDIKIPGAKDNQRLYFVPLDIVDDESKALSYAKSMNLTRKISGERVFIEGLPVGRYRIAFDKRWKDVALAANRVELVELSP